VVTGVFGGLLTGAAVWVLREPRASGRAPVRRRTPHRSRAGGRSLLSGAATVVGGALVAMVVGGPVGLGLGAAAAVALARWLGRLESSAARTRRRALTTELPWAADLLAAAVHAGLPLEAALRATAEAVGDPLAGHLRAVTAALALGAPPATAWAGADPALAPVGRAFTRAAEHGTSVSATIDRFAEDLRREAETAASAAVRAAGVHALAPLGACFLPGFLLLAVVPTVIGVGRTLLS